MCGIVGYWGKKPAVEVIVSGLHRLEYRGYDSAGVALCEGGKPLCIIKAPGKIVELENQIKKSVSPVVHATLGIGHTRWATHGAPTETNAHPHVSTDGNFAVVHNGIIENYQALRAKLTEAGYKFVSQTDTEVIAHLLQYNYKGDFREAFAATLKVLEGTYGIAAVSPLHPNMLLAARKGSPIVIGLGDDEVIIASDVSAVIKYTEKVIFLDDGDLVTVTDGRVDITSLQNVPVTRSATTIDWDLSQIEKGGHEHFMLKEIHEQPTALANAIRGRLVPAEGTVKLAGMQMGAQELASIARVTIAACGTSYYAGLTGSYFFEDFADTPADVQQAAEFRYRNPIIKRNTCLIAVSQSGETADTLAAVREGKRKGAVVLGLCNVVGSTIARETGRGVYLHAGPEIGVASTKAFTCQVTVLAMMAIALGRTRRLSMDEGLHMCRELERLPELAKRVLELDGQIAKVAEKYAKMNNAFFIGRGYMFPAAMEGALKMKEISYIHAEGYQAAELKHGPIALLDETVPVIACVPDIAGMEKTISNIQECRARKSRVLAITTEGVDLRDHADDVIAVPKCADFISPIPVVMVEQMLAYHVARLRGCSIDQPRNLAKSVTVE